MEVRRLKSDELQHHGVKGMHWGVRRYQNPDGSLTADGMKHYSRTKHYQKLKANSIQSNIDRAKYINKTVSKVKNNNTKTGFAGVYNNRTYAAKLSLLGTTSGLNKYRKDPKKYQKKVDDIISKLDQAGVKIQSTDVIKNWTVANGENSTQTYLYPGKYYSFKKDKKQNKE